MVSWVFDLFMKNVFVLFTLLFSLPLFAEEKESLTFEKWTPHFEVPDPVAISFDPFGRAYVTQTQRRKSQDLDIRKNLDWVVRDISSQSIEDKEALYREKFTPENSDANKHRVDDLNGDGIHDIADLQVLTERIHLVTDTDGDGYADQSSVFAEDMSDLLTGVAGGVLFHEGEVFTCPVPELIRFRDTDGDNVADHKTSLVRGFGVKIAYAGHDMHGLTAGPDGRLYWTVGDKGLSVTSKEGLKFHYPNEGALMRCEVDGSNFEVFAHGLRNIQEIAFDQYGNFFGVDNDADGKGEKERFVHVEQYSDAGWRSNWQYRMEKYNPWMDENLHIPYHEGQPLWITPPRSNYENGPAGFKFNPGTALSEKYRNHFFLTSAPRGQQWAFQIEPEGDSFNMVNDRQVGEGVALVGLCFGPDGGLYGVDWGATEYPLNEKGGVWRIDVPESEKHPLRKATKEALAADFTKMEEPDIATYFENPDQRVRLKAQYELAFRGDGFTLYNIAETSPDQLARIHAVWGLGQIVRSDWKFGQKALLKLLKSETDPEVLIQLLRVLSDRFGSRLALHEVPSPTTAMTDFAPQVAPFLSHDSVRVQVQALLALARIGDPAMTDTILDYLNQETHQLKDSMIRHAGTMALAGCVSSDQLKPTGDDLQFRSVCKVLALRKRLDATAALFLTHSDPVIAAEAAMAIYGDWTIPGAMPKLAEALGQRPENELFTRRSIAANLYGGTSEDAARVVTYLKTNPKFSKVALDALERWNQPNELDPVEGRYRPLETRDSEILTKALSPHLSDLLISQNTNIASRIMGLATDLKMPLSSDALLVIAENSAAPEDLKISALQGLTAQKHEKAVAIALNYLETASPDLKIAALKAITKLDKTQSLSKITALLEDPQTPPIVKQFAIHRLPEVDGTAILTQLWENVKSETAPPELTLDIIEAAGKSESLTTEVQAYEAASMAKAATEPLAPFLYTKTGGDVTRGKQVFDHHVAAQCVRCHKIEKGKGSDVGPILAGIGKKKGVDHLLESLVAPQAQVTKGYGTIGITLKNGSTVSGQFREETDKHVIVRAPDKTITKVKLEDIKERSPVVSTMPPMGFILTKPEMRDLIAYLMTL